ncbi:MAG: helix-turn-helix transcriptional regulator, partial [Rhodocyclaceae bacterium]|nr:helix-turn-helix transcriptional regulator [Rhodocyclaceae bacterium]
MIRAHKSTSKLLVTCAPAFRSDGEATVETVTVQGGKFCGEPCPIERGMRVLGGKWKASILWHLQDGPLRFN